jgi:RNA methyltransferase, TrmH family
VTLPRGPSESFPTIESTSNEQVRFVKTLYRATVRQRERLFVVEGVRLVEDALGTGAHPEIVLVSSQQLGRTQRGRELERRLRSFRAMGVTERVLDSVSDTAAPQGVIAVFQLPQPPPTSALGPVVVVLDRVRDPGNAGTILRSADASGVARTVAFVDSVDAFSPKVVRAGMGAHFRLTILDDMTWDRLLPRLNDRPRHLAVANGGTPYDRVDWRRDSALIIGGEAEGAGTEATTAATDRITIPMAGPAESLNAAMAATVILFDAARARRPEVR